MTLAQTLGTWIRDMVFGVRQLRRNWITNSFAVVTLGLGIGAAAAIFSIIVAVILRPLPFPRPDLIATLWSVKQGRDDVVTPRNFVEWKRNSRSFSEMAALELATFTLSGSGTSVQVPGGFVSADFFRGFGVFPTLGRSFTADEDKPPRAHLVVLSHQLWQQRFGADPAMIGKQIRLDREPYTVIGIMPVAFDLRPQGEQLWIPLALSGHEMNWAGGVLYVFGRLIPTVTFKRAQSEMEVIARALEFQYPEMNKNRGIRVGGYASDLVGDYRRQLLLLLGAVCSVLLIACSNIANLLLARGTGRAQELSIRAALGATRSRVVCQLLAESSIIALAGAAIGVEVADQVLRAAKLLAGATVPRLDQAQLDVPVLAFALGLGLLSTLLFGMLPAVRAARGDLLSSMQQVGRSAVGLARDRVKSMYIAAEVALALMLLVAAGLLIRTAVRAQGVDPGFVPERLIAGRTALPTSTYKTASQIIQIYERILDSLRAQRSVESAALTTKVPMSTSGVGLLIKAESTTPPLKEDFAAELRYVSPGYFSTIGVPLRMGRDFTVHDNADSVQVVILSDKMARRLWPGQNPIGKVLRLPEMETPSPLWQVIGVSADVHEDGLISPPQPVIFFDLMQVSRNPWHWAQQSMYLVARSRSEGMMRSDVLRVALNDVDSDLPLGDTRTLKDRLAQSLSAARFYMLVLSTLAGCALFLTAVGIYSVLAYFVSRQQAEIGIRLALGATPDSVLRLVVRQGMHPVLTGIVVGLLGSFATSRLLATQLYGVEAIDPLTIAGVVVSLAMVAMLACYFPARTAAQLDPMSALRRD